ncbi:MAG: DUF1254 domain-containing protein, partial [Sandaracinobacter sp.]
MRKFLIALLLLGAGVALLANWGRDIAARTASAALKAYPVYAVARTESETRFRARPDAAADASGLRHISRLSGPRDRWVTTPNSDTLYSSAFLDLSEGPVELDIPALPGRYHSVALMDARTDNWLILGTRDGEQPARTIRLEFGDGDKGARLPEGARIPTTYRAPTDRVWLLIRVLVDGPEDLAAAQAAQRA